MSIFDEVTGRYRAPRLDDLPPPPEPSIWRKAQQGLSDFMDSPYGALAEIPLTAVTAPQRAVESVIGAFRGGFELSEAERKAYGEEAYDRDAAVQKFGGGESIFDTAARRLRGRAYTAPTGGQIARETVAGAGELLGAPSTAAVMGLSRDPTKAGGYRPIAESEQQAFEAESPVLSRVAAPLRVGVDFAGSLATDPTSVLAFGPKLAARAGGTIAKEAAEAAVRSAALETARAERLASRLFVPGAVTGALGGTLEAGRAISEDGLFSPGAIEATLGAGLATGMGALAGRNAFRGLDSLPKPPGPELRSYGFDVEAPVPTRTARPDPFEAAGYGPVAPSVADLPPPPETLAPDRYARAVPDPETPIRQPEPAPQPEMAPEEGLKATFLEDATAEERGAYTNEVLETARRAYGDDGDGLAAYDRPGGGQDLVYRRGGKVVAAARVTPDGVASDLAGIDRVGSGHIARELGARQVQFHPDALSPDSVALIQKRKATPEQREVVANADTADIAQVAGLPMEQAAKGQADVAADAHLEFSPEALAVKRALRRVGDADVPATMERRKSARGPLPTDERGQQVYPGEEGLSPDEREALDGVVRARVRELELAQKSQPTGRKPILGGPALNDVQGYMGTPSHKTGTALEGISEGPKEIAAAIQRDKGNALELRVRDAVLRNDPELGEHFDRLAADRGEGDDSFPVEKYAVRPAPGQRGLEGIAEDVAQREPARPRPEQASLFGGRDMLQPTEARVTEGREADGPLFQKPEAQPEQGTLPKFATGEAPNEAGAAVSVDNIRRAFPTGKITENEGAWDVRLPGNRNIRVTPTGDVAFSLGDLQKGHPDAVGAEGLRPGMQVVGSWQRIGRGGLISLAKEAGQGTLDHETFHAAMDLVLSEREKKAILKRFGSEEKAADAYGAWTPAEKSNAIFAKMAAFFKRLYRILFPDAESVFGKVRSGEAFERAGTPFEEQPLPPRVAPAPTIRESRTVEPAEGPHVTGRPVRPGETPRVEHRVDDLAAATADAGIPEIPLDRETRQSWESLDPKVKDVLRTYDDQKFYDIMSRRNLDAVETQAFDAIIKGKSERLEALKRQERTPETDAQIAADTLDYIAAQRAYVNDGTGLARALAARARVMSAARPVEAFSRRLEAFRVTPQMAGEVLTAIRKDPSLLDMIRAEAQQRRLSVAEGGEVKFSAQAVAKLSDRLKVLGLSDEQSGAFVKALREDSAFLPELEAAVKNEAAEPTDVLLKKVFREIKGVSDEQAAEILEAFKENPDNLGPLLQSALGARPLRKALEWWRAGLLSSLSTDVANVSGNVAEHHIRLAETGVSGVLDWMLQKVYGGDRARFVGEMGAEMAGANMAFGPALKNLARNMADVATLKDKPLDLTKKLEGQVGAIGGTTGKIVRAIGFGRMGAEDVFFKEWGGGAEAMKLAYRKAANSLPAGSSKAEIKTKARQIIEEMADPENSSHADIAAAVEKAKDERTFQEKRVGSLTDALSGLVRRNPMLSFVAPFVNTPGNIANAIIKRSPLGAKRAIQAFGEFKKAQADFTAGKIDQAAFSAARGKLADAIASPLLGTAMLAGFTLYANAGGMTGSGPTDERAKNALKESGWSPYSFVFTDPTTGKKAYVPFNRFEPVSSLLGFAADMAEAKNVRNLSLFDKALGSVVENLTSKSYLTGLSEAASLITKPKEFAPQYIKGFVGSWVPNIVGRTAAAIDPLQRDTRASKGGFAGLPEAIGKNIQSRIPFASMALPARMSSTGAPVERPGNALTRFAAPVQPTIERPERFLEREYGRLGWAPTAPSRNVTIKGIQTNLDDNEMDTMVKAQRRASDEARNLIRSAHYKSLPDDQRELLLDRIYSKWKARGRQSIRAKLERRVAREARA